MLRPALILLALFSMGCHTTTISVDTGGGDAHLDTDNSKAVGASPSIKLPFVP